MSLHELCLVWGLLVVSLPGAAWAEDARESPDLVSYTFQDDLVGGSVRSSDLAILSVRTRKERDSLIRIREHFVPELYESVEDL